ncbi:zonular occludens toxin domain-containing protein [Tatumella sp. UCD-D_suzukii]|uniref:zonular occludens toxin domain-containing protein n=1 Tax=Tatumella sp. UCD-D_suzukii TaxID=1408192 RepID=UPI000471D03B|nr:zonular occludens toxin domain-containing protein [Tatumella sp. UCD-D_suzukii]
MAVHVVTGKLGAGKTLVTIGRIQDYLARGRVVATNLNLKLHHMPRVGRFAKMTRVIRIPDKPSLEDFESIGRGTTSYNEADNGLLVLDECGTWFNSRNWSDKSRQPVIDWCLHARKLGWDVIFIIQDVSLMDKQAREALAEHVVYCRRMDKLNIPIIGGLISLFANSRLPLPKIHFGIVKYGDNPQALTVDKWVYTGKDLYAAYDTKQIFSANYDSGSFCLIPPYYTHGQFSIIRDFKYYMRMTRIYFKRMNRVWLMSSFLALGAGLGMLYKSNQLSSEIAQLKLDPKVDHITKSDHVTDNLPRLSINSYSQMGYDVSVSFKDSNSKIYNSFDLIKDGYKLDVKDACHVTIVRKSYIQQITCEG